MAHLFEFATVRATAGESSPRILLWLLATFALSVTFRLAASSLSSMVT
ncbi:hypothetical protein [Lentzea sp. CA-135723]